MLTALPFTASAATLDEAAQSTGASSGTTGDCTWTLDDDGVLTISGNGAMGKYNINTAPWGENITSVIINDGVTNIGQDAFYGCYGLTRVTIGKGVTSIDPYAFYNCIGLTSITIPDSVTSIGDQAFHSCYYLKSVTLGNGVKRIGDYSFSWCEDLNQITIPYSVSDIGYGAFEGCTHITEIYIPDSVTKIRDRAFAECELSVITVDGNNKKYDSRNNCNAIIETETNSLISGCKNTVIPDSVTWIDNSAFYGCQNLTGIVIPDSVTGIDEWAFYCCKKLSRITIPTTTTTIFQSSFAECGLSNIIVKEGNPVYDSRNNCNAIIETKSNTLVFGSFNTVIPNSVTSIGDEAFSGCSQITNISIPNSVTSIGDYAFYECESLTSISIPDSVRNMGYWAFGYCRSLTNVSISSSVTEINDDTFRYCSNLTNITIPSSVTRIGMNVFSCCYKLNNIYIPDSVISIGSCAFQETGWFKNQPNGLVYAGKVAYMIKGDCPTEIEIKSGTLGIADMAFEDFENITSVSIPPTLKNIGERAFLGCSALSSVKIPNSVISIGRMAFCGCLSSNSIIIPDSVETIGQWAFGYGLGPQKIDGFTIYGYTGSEAQKYSNHYGFPFIALDLNDTEKPVVSLSSTNSVAASQTVTLSLNDNKGVKGYYWGTSASYSNNSYTTSSSTSVSKTVDSAGTYYATAVDTSGNVSSTVSITFYKTTLNANGGSVSPSSVLTKSGNSFTFPTPTRSNYNYVGWGTSSSTSASNAVKTLSPSSNATYYAVWSNADSQKPTVSLSSTNNVAASQTVTISMSDNVGIKGYYWGTSASYSNNTYTTSSSTSVTKTVNSLGTYYVAAVDTSGNISDNKSITFYKTTLNANGGSVSPTSVLTKLGNSFTFPTPTRSNYSYVGWSTSSTATSGVKTLSPTSSLTYYAVWKTNSSFVWGQDNWNFKNSAPTYFPSSTYRKQINNSYLNKLKSNLTNSEYQTIFQGTWYSGAWLDDRWGGSCYGMSSLALLSKDGLLPYSSYQSGATKLHDLGYPKNNSNLNSLITYYQMLQVKDVIQQQYRTVPNKSNQENITNLINLLDKNSTVLVGFKKAGWGGHAILAIGYEYGSWTFNGVSYQGCIKICDPNASTGYNTRYNIYFNTKSYNWTIPAYSNMTSTAGAKFNYIGATVNEINKGGYLSDSSGNRVEAFVARIDATAISDNRSVSKVENTNGVYMNQSSQPNEIVEDYSFILGNESEGTIGYNLYDANSSYKISQSNAEKLQLYMDYENCSLTGGSAAGESVIFDKSGYVEVNGESAMYNMSMTYDETYPTDWFTIQVQGYNANSASLRMVNDGYVLTADNLENVSLRANNRKTYAQAAFTTEYNSVFIYEIDENTIGIKVDTDNNGTYETELPTDTFEIGDTNGDGIVNIRDVTAIQRHLADLDILTGTSFLVADTNGDGTVSIDDATHLQMYLAEFDVFLGKQN